ncbi:DUF4181 domain-containing protein [Bacillaceae bacterium W0354]
MNDHHKKINFASIVIFAVLLLVLILLYVLDFPIGIYIVIVILSFPVLSSVIDLFIFLKYDRGSKQYILSISQIILYTLFLIILFTSKLFGLID